MWGPPLAARRYKDWTSQRAAQGGGPYSAYYSNKITKNAPPDRPRT